MLSTDRLLLHALSPADAAALLKGEDPALLTAGRAFGWHAGKGWPHDDTFDALRGHAEHGSDELPGPWLVLHRESSAILGEVGWHGGPDATGTAEVGYGLSPAVRGQGYGTEAVRAWCQWAVTRADVTRIVADVLPGNTPSIRLLERLGFVASGPGGAGHVRYVQAHLAPGPRRDLG